MKKLYFVLIALFTCSSMAYSQDCTKTCKVQKEIGEGVFLGVQIYSNKNFEGTKIIKIVEGTEAQKMGLKVGDLIQTINGVPMESSNFMVNWVGSKKAGLPVDVVFVRQGKQQTLKGKLGYKEVKLVEETICCGESVNQLEVKKLDIYPNPSTGQFQLKSEMKDDQPVQLQIIDHNGQVHYENTLYPKGQVINQTINVNSRLRGDYVLILQQDGNIKQEKIVFIQ